MKSIGGLLTHDRSSLAIDRARPSRSRHARRVTRAALTKAPDWCALWFGAIPSRLQRFHGPVSHRGVSHVAVSHGRLSVRVGQPSEPLGACFLQSGAARHSRTLSKVTQLALLQRYASVIHHG